MMARFNRGIALLLLCLLPMSLLQAEIQGAMLYTKGLVKINGASARPTSPLLIGDSLQTSADGSAQIVAEGTFVQVQPASSVVYNKSSVTLQDGVATISSERNLSGRVNHLSIVPSAGNSARYILRFQNGRIQVAALMGNVSISGAPKPIVLKAGEVYTEDTSSSTAPDPQSGNTTKLGDDNTGILFAVTAAVIVAVVIGLLATQSLSPSGP